jgi:hypothetical protein
MTWIQTPNGDINSQAIQAITVVQVFNALPKNKYQVVATLNSSNFVVSTFPTSKEAWVYEKNILKKVRYLSPHLRL